MHELASIDYVIIAFYMAGVLFVGSYFRKHVRSTGDLFLAGRSLPFWAIGMSIVVSDIGAIDLMTGAGAAYDRGIAQANFDWIGSVPALLIAAFIFVPYYWRAGVYTLPEFLGRRYNGATRWVLAVVLLFFMLVTLSILLWSSAVFLNKVLGWNHLVGIWVTALIVGFYTVSGGLAAVVMTDVMQLIVMFVGTAALLAMGLWEVGGWSGLKELVLAQQGTTDDYFRLLHPHEEGTEYPWTGMVFSLGIVMSTAYYVGNQAVMQRALGARTEWDAKAGLLVAGVFKMMIPMLVFLPGMAARALVPDLPDSEAAIPMLINRLPTGGIEGPDVRCLFCSADVQRRFVSELLRHDFHRRHLSADPSAHQPKHDVGPLGPRAWSFLDCRGPTVCSIVRTGFPKFRNVVRRRTNVAFAVSGTDVGDSADRYFLASSDRLGWLRGTDGRLLSDVWVELAG